MTPINIHQKLALFNDHWHPRILAELNGQQVKLAKLKGEFIWHQHEEEDELFFVLSGKLTIEFQEYSVDISEHEMIIVPKGTEHRPVAKEEVVVMLFEPKSTINTGNVQDEMTQEQLDWI